MALGDPIITSAIVAGTFFEQPGTTFTESLDSWDVGVRSWLTHPDTTRDQYPAIGSADSTYPLMKVLNVEATREESTMKLITATYRGAIRTNGSTVLKPHYLAPGVSTQMVTLPALTGGGDSQKRTLIVPVPMPTLTRIFLTGTEPNFNAVGNAVTASYLPPPGAWAISYLPDPDAILPTNYYTGWVLMSRSWDSTILSAPWLVQEEYQWFWPIAT